MSDYRILTAPGACDQCGTQPGQGEKPQNIESYLTMGKGAGPKVGADLMADASGTDTGNDD